MKDGILLAPEILIVVSLTLSDGTFPPNIFFNFSGNDAQIKSI